MLIMCKCLLCQEKEATKKGSHVIPSFFMKRINSIDGCNERDHELGFSIGLGTVGSYFGRDVYEERRRQYTDDERRIEDRTNLDVLDNVFCPECEKLFSQYESKYCKTYNLPFDKELVENTCVSAIDAALFWYSVVWRISSTEHSAVRLHSEFEEKLRRIIISGNTSGSDIFYSLNYCNNYRSSENPTFALFDCSGDVAMLLVDEFLLVVFNGEHATRNDKWLWKMNFKCQVSKLNNGIKPEVIRLYPAPVFKFINDHIINQLIQRIDFRRKFNEMHKELFGRDMPEFFYTEVMDEIDKAKLADKYTVQNYAMSVKRVIQAHPNIYKVKFVEK